MTRTEEELRKEYEEYSRMYNNPKHWEGWLIDEIGRVENYLEEIRKLAEFLTIEAGKHSKRCKELEHKIERKAEAYDRLMSGGKKTLKEWANIFGTNVAINHNGDGVVSVTPLEFNTLSDGYKIAGYWSVRPGYPYTIFNLPHYFIDYIGDWKDSLTLPDGWEEA